MTKVIKLTNNCVTIVDDIDYDYLMSFGSWYTQQGYAGRSARSGSVRMHRIILSRMIDRDLLSSDVCDHINQDKLDNRRCNLRLATVGNNNANKISYKSNTTGYKGVNYIKSVGKYRARVQHNGKRISLGLFDTPEEAASAYNVAAIKYQGEFACINVID